MQKEAIRKLKDELKAIRGGKNFVSVVKKPVTDALISFCKQEPEFAQAIVQSDKKLEDCLKAVIKDVKEGISDIDAYTRAVRFYFPTAGINFKMTVDLCANTDLTENSDLQSNAEMTQDKPQIIHTKNENVSEEKSKQDSKSKKSVLELSFDDLFDF